MKRFAAQLRELVAPLASISEVDIALERDGRIEWIFRNDPPGPDVSGRESRISPDFLPEAVLIVNGRPSEEVLQGVLRIAEAVHHRLELEAEQVALLDELSLCWESLEAVQEIGWKLRSVQNPGILLDGIMARTTAFQDKLCSILWQKNGPDFQAIAARGAVVGANQKPGILVVRAVAKGNGIIVGGREQIRQLQGLHPEAQSAHCIAVAPIATPSGSIAVLEVWSNNPSARFDSRTMRLLETLALQGAMVIENDRLYRTTLSNVRLQKEIEIGSKIQQTLLLARPPRGVRGIKISAMSVASRYIDGDFYDFIDHGGDRLDVMVGDVMGKGVPAALLAAATKQQFLEAFARISPSGNGHGLPGIDEIVTWVNRKLSRRLSMLDWFTTLCYLRFDLTCRRIEYINAGHPKTLHFRARERTCTELEGRNLPLGLSEMEHYDRLSCDFCSGDYFFLYSDGVTETESEEGELFGKSRLAEFIVRHNRLNPDQLIEELKKELIGFSGTESFSDDLTCVAVQIE